MSGSLALRVLLSAVMILAVLWAIWLPVRALAHPPDHFLLMGEANEEWLRNLKNDKGSLCCNGKDGYDAIYDTRDGHYRVLLYGTYWVVPDEAIIKEPNKLGVAQVWYMTLWSTTGVPTPTIRCFLPGAGI